MESKKNQTHRNREQTGGCHRQGVKVIKKYKLPFIRLVNPGDVTYNMVTIVNNCIVYLKVANGIDLKSSHHQKKKIYNYVR